MPNNNNGGAMTTTQGAVAATTRTRRMLTPAEIHARAKLEFTHYPLYSSVILTNALSRENNLFNYALGDPVSGTPAAGGGTIVANDLFTNLETARFLANPKLFVVRGIGLVISNANFNAGGAPTQQDTQNAGATAINAVINLQHILYAGFLRFRVGTKTYAEAPVFRFPSCLGIDGPAALAYDDDATAGFMFAQALYAKGKPWQMDTYPVTIYPQQTFSAALEFIATTSNPTNGYNAMVTCVLNGILGRETQ